MNITKSTLLQILMAGCSGLMLVLSILCVGKIIPIAENSLWVWGVLTICFGFVLIEAIVYFVFGKNDVLQMVCKWLVVLFGVILLIMTIVLLAVSASTMFADFGALTGWLQFVFVLIAFAICAMMIAYLIVADKDQKQARQAQREQETEAK